MLPNGPEFLEIVLALMAMGAAAAPLNPAFTADEVEFFLATFDPRMVLAVPGANVVEQVAAARAMPFVEVTAGPGKSVELHADGATPVGGQSFEAAEADDVALLLYTSGTTGRPKQVPLLDCSTATCPRLPAPSRITTGWG